MLGPTVLTKYEGGGGGGGGSRSAGGRILHEKHLLGLVAKCETCFF